jgi:hypothetical protein
LIGACRAAHRRLSPVTRRPGRRDHQGGNRTVSQETDMAADQLAEDIDQLAEDMKRAEAESPAAD